ncbi:hypothetical protein N665_0201s0264 [Sinapis alba]|nr:hypothetical protein N665_0201s0264 [Sinapis alba]
MDIINGLSDHLLVKILLLVPTKVAVSTSILSKRWEYLWMWLPKLEYDDLHFSESEYERLQSFLDRNLPLHRAPVMESFRLYLLNSFIKPENINMWVSTAVSQCIRELDISYETGSFDPTKPVMLPSNLYTCKSLVVLKLEVGILLDVPRMVSLPSLKTLKLLWVRYFNEDTLRRLLSNCPILEDLVVDLREFGSTATLIVAVPSLKSLSLSIPFYHDIDGIVIETPSLKYFKLTDHYSKSHYCLIEHMPNLMEAHIYVEFPDINSLIGSITSVTRLAICSKASCDESFFFNKLEHLEVCTCKEHSSYELVRAIELIFMKDDRDQVHDPEEMVNWSSYTGEPQESDILVYILKRAVHLKTATIKSLRSDVRKLEMLKKLALSSRASATCQLMFE